MENEIVDPRMYVAGYVKAPGVPYQDGKKYLAKLVGTNLPLLIGREEFKRASEAEAAAKAWKGQLLAEYEAALLESTLPRVAEEGERTVTGEA